MILKQHVREALEVIRKFRSISASDTDPGHPREIVIDAILKMFPADDDEPITQEWVDEMWPVHTDDGPIIIEKPIVKLAYQGCGEWALFMCPVTGDVEWDMEVLRFVATRGDVLAFLRGMGIDTKVGA